MSNMSTLLTLGLVGVGGYLFIKEVWPMLKDSFEGFDLDGLLGGGSGGEPRGPPPGYDDFADIPRRGSYQPIIEDRFPDYVIEDRYPDYVYEDRYPDYYPSYPYPYPTYPVPLPTPIYTPPLCPPGKYWNGDRCKTIDIDCPPGYKEDDGICKPRDRDCDSDEHWNGHRCEKCGRGEFWNGSRCVDIPRIPRPDFPDRPRPRPKLPDRDRGNRGRDKGVDDKIKAVVEAAEGIGKPETKRLEEITEKAKQSFLEVWYA